MIPQTTDTRFKELMEQCGLPDSKSLAIVLRQLDNEVSQKYEAELAELQDTSAHTLLEFQGWCERSNDYHAKNAIGRFLKAKEQTK